MNTTLVGLPNIFYTFCVTIRCLFSTTISDEVEHHRNAKFAIKRYKHCSGISFPRSYLGPFDGHTLNPSHPSKNKPRGRWPLDDGWTRAYSFISQTWWIGGDVYRIDGEPPSLSNRTNSLLNAVVSQFATAAPSSNYNHGIPQIAGSTGGQSVAGTRPDVTPFYRTPPAWLFHWPQEQS